MSRRVGLAAGVLVFALLAGSTVAQAKTKPKMPPSGSKYVNGILCVYKPRKLATIAPPNSDCLHMTIAVRLTKRTKLDDETMPASAVATGDSAAVFLAWKSGHATAKSLEFGTSGFIFRHEKIAGRFQGSVGSCPLATLSLKSKASKKADSISTFAYTRYTRGGKASTCSDALSALTKGEVIKVKAGEATDGSLSASTVNVPS